MVTTQILGEDNLINYHQESLVLFEPGKQIQQEFKIINESNKKENEDIIKENFNFQTLDNAFGTKLYFIRDYSYLDNMKT